MKDFIKKLPPLRDLLAAGGCAASSVVVKDIDIKKIVFALASVAFLAYGWGRMIPGNRASWATSMRNASDRKKPGVTFWATQ